jgi:phage shock protein PspC (stress-responsive transcriptional regulator)
MKRLYLSRTDRKLFGVCGGLAEYFNVDSTIVRIGVVVFALITAVIPVLVAYLIAKFVIPESPAT